MLARVSAYERNWNDVATYALLRAKAALAEAGVSLYRTDLQGTVVCRVRGGKLSFEPEHSPDAAVYLAPPLPEGMVEEE